MSNRPILITGCQRSGTTLVHLILDSHPKIHGIDEWNYRESELDQYLSCSKFKPRVAFKLPRYAPELRWIKALGPHLRIVWCVRDPRDVVTSMLALRLPAGKDKKLAWPSHPGGAAIDIARCVPLLPEPAKRELGVYLQRYAAIQKISPAQRTRLDELFVAALCWRIKNELVAVYATAGIKAWVVTYERLVNDPAREIAPLLKYAGVRWHPRVLQHHRLHRGMHIGNTDFARPIDTTKIARWQDELSCREQALVYELCADTARGFGYSMPLSRPAQ